jgi:endonuclease/exonuclease/phosphatase family metal-dependent hydrolase
MTATYKLLFFLFLLTGTYQPLLAQVHQAMTFNIRYDTPRDSINRWDNRKAEIVDLVQYYQPAALGIQEGLWHQVEYLEDNLPNYARIGVGRDDGKEKGEFSAIFYDSTKLKLLAQETFWLSPTPDRVSVGWDASMERICTYGLFEEKGNGRKIYIFNAHYDHIGQQARVESSRLILSKIQDINTLNYPIIVMGDFNAEPDTAPTETFMNILDDGAKLAENGIYGPIGTFTGFTKNAIPKRRIDYIFTKNLTIKTYRHIDDKMRNGNYLSDHLPVFVEFF